MPILMPSTINFTRSLENITINGINVDKIISSSIVNDLKDTFKKDYSKMVKFSKKLRAPLKESSIASPVSTNTLKNRLHTSKTSEQKKNRCRVSYNRHSKNDIKTKIKKKENLVKEGPLDDSLTSLQWLTGVKVGDLMEGRPIHYSPPSPAQSLSSGSSDDKRWISNFSSENTFDYREAKEVKPPYSYAVLIIMAMKSKTCGKMTLSEIYKWISENFVFYRNAEPTWQNSIRHNLSLNKCFAKIPRQKGDTGKGGYWTVIPEFSNRVLENSIRKRRSNVYSPAENDTMKRQRLDVLENQLLCNIKAEKELDHNSKEQVLPKTLLDDMTLTPFKDSSADEVNELEYYQLDHSYGKSPVVNYNVSDVENIRAIATHLEDTTSSVDMCTDITLVQPSRAISSTLRTDCIWSAGSMSKVTEELLEAQKIYCPEHTVLRNLDNSLNNSNSFDSLFYCLSPPLSGDDESYCDDLDDLGNDIVSSENVLKYLTVKGTSMTLFGPKTEISNSLEYDIKLEPLSPISEDLNE